MTVWVFIFSNLKIKKVRSMYSILASMYTQVQQFYYVKVEVDGLYISGIKVSVSKKYPNTLWIQMPSYKQGVKWKRYIESEKDSPLGQAIYKAIEDHMSPIIFGDATNTNQQSTDVVLDDIDSELNFDDIPFN